MYLQSQSPTTVSSITVLIVVQVRRALTTEMLFILRLLIIIDQIKGYMYRRCVREVRGKIFLGWIPGSTINLIPGYRWGISLGKRGGDLDKKITVCLSFSSLYPDK